MLTFIAVILVLILIALVWGRNAVRRLIGLGGVVIVIVGLLLIGFTAIYRLSMLDTTSSNTVQDVIAENRAIFKGECHIQLFDDFLPCDSRVTYTQLATGRSLLFFTMDNYLITLSGGKDRQPNLQNYFLYIDKMVMTDTSKELSEKSGDSNMQGECHFSLNKAGTVFYYIRCDVSNPIKGSTYKLYLENISETDRQSLQ